jgi:hypothetical protein
MVDQGEGTVKYTDINKYVLPADNPRGKRIWTSGGEDSRAMPCKIRPLTHNMEMKVVISLIEELRSKMALDLDTAPSFDRSLGSQTKPKKKSEFLLVGCCNSKEEAEVLRNRGRVVCTIFAKDWRVNRTSAASMANAIRKQIEDEDPATIILELLDNSLFYCKQEDRSRVIPKKGADDIYHIEGELLVCSRDVQAEQFNLLRPIFEAAESRRVIWTVPTPWYITGSCCDDSLHMLNRQDQYLRENISIQLDSLKKNMRDFTHYSFKKMKVYDPNQELKGMSSEEIWTDSSTKVSTEAATKIVDGLLQFVDSSTSSREEVVMQNSQNPGHAEGRGRGHCGSNYRGNRGGATGRGRHHDPEQRFGGRGSRGGHRDFMARPY